MVRVTKGLMWMGFGMGENRYFTFLVFALFWNEAVQSPVCSALSTEPTSGKLGSCENPVLISALPAVIVCGLQCDGTRMRCPQNLVCGHTLFNHAVRFLVLQKDFLTAYNSTVLLSHLDWILQWSNSLNTTTSFLFLRANGVIFMMHILSINLFYRKKIFMFSTSADFMSLNVDVPGFF